MRIRIISGSLSEIDRTLNDYGHEHHIDNDNLLNVDEEGVKCLERELGIRYETVDGYEITPEDIYKQFMTEK